MKATLILIFSFILSSNSFEISFDKKDVADWSIINDGVMGGLSKGILEATKDGIRFSGQVSLENYGGFTSYKSPFQSYDLSAYEKMVIRYRSEGFNIGFQLETEKRFYLPYFKINLPVSSDWKVLSINLSEFKQYRMGDLIGKTINKEDLKEIKRMGFINNDKKEGKFEFEIDYIRFE